MDASTQAIQSKTGYVGLTPHHVDAEDEICVFLEGQGCLCRQADR